MRVAISDFRALLYVRCFWVRMVRATLFCLASTWNWKPETGLAVVVDAKAALEPVLDRLERKNGAVVGMVADMFFFFFVLVL